MKKSWLVILALALVLLVSAVAMADDECNHDSKTCYVIDVRHTCVGSNEYEILETQETCLKCKEAIGSSELCVMANTGSNTNVTINTQAMSTSSLIFSTRELGIGLGVLLGSTQIIVLVMIMVQSLGRRMR